jgi:hypothetical protein
MEKNITLLVDVAPQMGAVGQQSLSQGGGDGRGLVPTFSLGQGSGQGLQQLPPPLVFMEHHPYRGAKPGQVFLLQLGEKIFFFTGVVAAVHKDASEIQ